MGTALIGVPKSEASLSTLNSIMVKRVACTQTIHYIESASLGSLGFTVVVLFSFHANIIPPWEEYSRGDIIRRRRPALASPRRRHHRAPDDVVSKGNTQTLDKLYTPWAIKRSQLIFVSNFIKNQRILMQFSPLDLEVNGTCDSMNVTHLTQLMLLHYLVKVKTPNMEHYSGILPKKTA